MHASTRDINRCLRTRAEGRGRERKREREKGGRTYVCCVCVCTRVRERAHLLIDSRARLCVRVHRVLRLYMYILPYAFAAEIYAALRCIHHSAKEREREGEGKGKSENVEGLSRVTSARPRKRRPTPLLSAREFTFGYNVAHGDV